MQECFHVQVHELGGVDPSSALFNAVPADGRLSGKTGKEAASLFERVVRLEAWWWCLCVVSLHHQQRAIGGIIGVVGKCFGSFGGWVFKQKVCYCGSQCLHVTRLLFILVLIFIFKWVLG